MIFDFLFKKKEEEKKVVKKSSSPDEKFFLYSYIDKRSILNDIKKNHMVIQCGIESKNLFITTVLHYDEEIIIFDAINNSDIIKLIEKSDLIYFSTNINKVKIHFEAKFLYFNNYEDSLALYVSIPEKILKLQRRNFLRVHVPLVTNSHITFIHMDMEYKCTLHDISAGGLSVRTSLFPEMAFNEIIEKVTLKLDNVTFDVSLQFKHQKIIDSDNNLLMVGFSFLETTLNNNMKNHIQQFVIKIDQANMRIKHS